MTRRVREIHHIGVDGAPVVQVPQLLSEVVEKVVCGWCEQSERVEELHPSAEAP